jgi:hypothetical protein
VRWGGGQRVLALPCPSCPPAGPTPAGGSAGEGGSCAAGAAMRPSPASRGAAGAVGQVRRLRHPVLRCSHSQLPLCSPRLPSSAPAPWRTPCPQTRRRDPLGTAQPWLSTSEQEWRRAGKGARLSTWSVEAPAAAHVVDLAAHGDEQRLVGVRPIVGPQLLQREVQAGHDGGVWARRPVLGCDRRCSSSIVVAQQYICGDDTKGPTRHSWRWRGVCQLLTERPLGELGASSMRLFQAMDF